MEIKSKMQYYQVNMACTECYIGVMVRSNSDIIMDQYSPKYLHHCNNGCGHRETYTKPYPSIEFEKLNTMFDYIV